MGVITHCTHCGSTQPLSAGFVDADGKQFALFLGALEPAMARAIAVYIGLWKPKKTRLTNLRALKIAREVIELADAGMVKRDHDSVATTPEDWINAMHHMHESKPLRIPLDSHGYLREVVMSMALKRDRAVDQLGYEQRLALDKQLAEKEASLRSGKRPKTEAVVAQEVDEKAEFLRMQAEFQRAITERKS
jgi:hypothetical protein